MNLFIRKGTEFTFRINLYWPLMNSGMFLRCIVTKYCLKWFVCLQLGVHSSSYIFICIPFFLQVIYSYTSFLCRVLVGMKIGICTANTSIAMRLRRNMSVTVKNSWTSLRYASYKKSSKDMTNFWRLTNFFYVGTVDGRLCSH